MRADFALHLSGGLLLEAGGLFGLAAVCEGDRLGGLGCFFGGRCGVKVRAGLVVEAGELCADGAECVLAGEWEFAGAVQDEVSAGVLGYFKVQGPCGGADDGRF